MSLFDPPAQLVVGPRRHGVVEYASDVADAVARRCPSVEILSGESVGEALAGVGTRRRLHVHVTDALFGANLDAAAEAVDALTSAHSVSMTLHDLPQPSDGARNLPRRAEAYSRFVRGAAGVSVSSAHEATLFGEHLSAGTSPAILPLGTRATATWADRTDEGSDRPALVMAGYVYPGKGHDDVLEAAAELVRRGADGVRLTVLGGVVPGHEPEAARLRDRARETGVEIEITGYLDRAAYARCLAEAGTPVVAHQHYSASRSLLDWAEAGRRAVVVSTRYTDEMAALRPGTITLAPRDARGLADVLAASTADPSSTRLRPGLSLSPTLDDTAGLALAWWAGLTW